MVNIELDLNKLKHNKEINIHPWFITGFSEGKSPFSIRIKSNLINKFSFHLSLIYSVEAELNIENYKLLILIKNYFNDVGFITKCGNMYVYEVSSLEDLKLIREHFERYPIQTSKKISFLLWCQIMDLIKNKYDLTIEDFMNILSFEYLFPKEVSSFAYQFVVEGKIANLCSSLAGTEKTWKLEKLYSNINFFVRPELNYINTSLHPNWISGFVQALGIFDLNVTKAKWIPLGYTCQPEFRIAQYKLNYYILVKIIEELNCGNIVKSSIDNDVYIISVSNLNDLIEKIIPFFKTYPIYGAKLLDFNDFNKGIDIMKNKGHLNKNGLNQLKVLASSKKSYR